MSSTSEEHLATGQLRKVTAVFRSRNGDERTERTLGTPQLVSEQWDRRRGELLEVLEGWHGND
jgi:hypothetical protein